MTDTTDTFMSIKEPFRYTFGVGVIPEDLSELREEMDYRLGDDQGLNHLDADNQILNKYPYSKKVLSNYFHHFSKQVFGYANDFVITTSWLVRLKPGDTVREHWHANSYYSGLFYYGDYDGVSGDIRFSNPIRESTSFQIQPGIFNAPMHQDWSFTPVTNLLVMFPSSIRHHVDAYEGKEDRQSLAFNIIPKGCYGIGDSYIDTSWTQ